MTTSSNEDIPPLKDIGYETRTVVKIEHLYS